MSIREVLGVAEFRVVLASSGLSILGDQVARIAVALLVYERGGSAFAASATYACSYLTWLIGGPALSALADRHRRRRLMVTCDLLRAVLVAVLVLPDLPLWVLFAVLVLVGLLAPPFDSARSALLPEVLEGDRYVTGNAVSSTVAQAAQVGGFALGGLLVGVAGARGALALDALTFLVSGLLLAVGLRERPAPTGGTTLVRDVREGVRLVVHDRVLRRLLAYGVLAAVVMIAPEGLAVPVADRLGGGATTTGLLTAAVPAGFLVGSFLLLRVPVDRRLEVVPRLVALACLPLLLTPLVDVTWVVGLLWLLAGAFSSASLVVNAAYMVAAPPDARGRAYGMAVSALMAVQGVTLLIGGALAEVLDPRLAVTVLAAVALAVTSLLGLAPGRATPAPRPAPSFGSPAVTL